MKIVNLTPHQINIYVAGLGGNELLLEVESTGVARCKVERKQTGSITVANGQETMDCNGLEGIVLYNTQFGEVTGLPESQKNTIYVVSMLVAQAAKRSDVYSPGELLRDASGKPIGCLGLSQ